MIQRIRLAGVWVTDQQKAYEFWVDGLGFTVQADATLGNGYRWLEVVPPGAETALTLAKPYPNQNVPIGVASNIVFTTDNMTVTYETMVARGVHFLEKPTMQLWGNQQARFTDPDGNSFLLVDRQ